MQILPMQVLPMQSLILVLHAVFRFIVTKLHSLNQRSCIRANYDVNQLAITIFNINLIVGALVPKTKLLQLNLSASSWIQDSVAIRIQVNTLSLFEHIPCLTLLTILRSCMSPNAIMVRAEDTH